MILIGLLDRVHAFQVAAQPIDTVEKIPPRTQTIEAETGDWRQRTDLEIFIAERIDLGLVG